MGNARNEIELFISQNIEENQGKKLIMTSRDLIDKLQLCLGFWLCIQEPFINVAPDLLMLILSISRFILKVLSYSLILLTHSLITGLTKTL